MPRGTGYIPDVGMCGESGGVLGMDPDCVVERMRTKIGHKFVASQGACRANGVIFDIDTKTGRVVEVRRINF